MEILTVMIPPPPPPPYHETQSGPPVTRESLLRVLDQYVKGEDLTRDPRDPVRQVMLMRDEIRQIVRILEGKDEDWELNEMRSRLHALREEE